MRTCQFSALTWLLAAIVACSGCWGPSSQEEDEKAPFVLGDMLEPFNPPTLEELEAQVEWVDRPVLVSMELKRERQQDEEVLATVEEALALRIVEAIWLAIRFITIVVPFGTTCASASGSSGWSACALRTCGSADIAGARSAVIPVSAVPVVAAGCAGGCAA